jgi:D-alanyl-D-alanine carboxypeptidase (penicillin-binding protein 5/6)
VDHHPPRLRLVTAVALVSALIGLTAAGLATPASAVVHGLHQGPPPAKAFALVDADTGDVLAGDNARQPRRVASTAKLLTALVARPRVPFEAPVTISPRAAGLPALNINAKAGQVWRAADLYECLFLISANDAAMALAEAAGPGLDNFHAELADLAKRLGLADSPVLQDPAGLDDDFSVNGGNLLSARDLAIAARAVLADPVLAPLATQREYRFKGGDGLDHRLVNHDHFLSEYPGAVGLKTGYTKQAGASLVAAATRNGRTLVAVVLDAADPVAVATSLLDLGWAAPRTGHSDRLPPVPGSAAATGSPAAASRPLVLKRSVRVSSGGPTTSVLVLVGGLGLLAIAAVGAVSVLRERRVAVSAARRRGRGPSRSGSPSPARRAGSGRPRRGRPASDPRARGGQARGSTRSRAPSRARRRGGR